MILRFFTRIRFSQQIVLGVSLFCLLMGLMAGIAFGVGRGLQWDNIILAKTRGAGELNENFQLSVSKAKNFIVLQDPANKDKSLAYLEKAREIMAELHSGQLVAGKAEHLDTLEAELLAVDAKLNDLFKVDVTKHPHPKALYENYLKGVTSQFDKAADAYKEHIKELAVAKQDNLFAKGVSAKTGVWMAIALALIGAFSVLGTAWAAKKTMLAPVNDWSIPWRAWPRAT